MRFAFRLAAHLRLSLRDVMAMPAPEFAAWMSYYAVEPWGLADQVLASFGGGKPQTADFASTKAALLDWAGGADGTA